MTGRDDNRGGRGRRCGGGSSCGRGGKGITNQTGTIAGAVKSAQGVVIGFGAVGNGILNFAVSIATDSLDGKNGTGVGRETSVIRTVELDLDGLAAVVGSFEFQLESAAVGLFLAVIRGSTGTAGVVINADSGAINVGVATGRSADEELISALGVDDGTIDDTVVAIAASGQIKIGTVLREAGIGGTFLETFDRDFPIGNIQNREDLN